MTGVLAWTDATSAYLVADTAVTSSRALTGMPAESSLGQRQTSDDGRSVFESEQKILRVGAHTLVAFTGDVASATAFAISLRHELRTNDSIESAIGRVGARTFAGATDFVAVIATHEPSGPALYGFVSVEWRLHRFPDREVVVFGSIQEKMDVVDALSDSVRRAAGLGTPSARLTAVLVEANTLALINDLVSAYVGGVFIGGLVNSAGAAWQAPILYAPCRPDFAKRENAIDSVHFVLAEIIEDVATVVSTMAQAGAVVRKILGSGAHENYADWWARNEAFVKTQGPWARCANVALLPLTHDHRRIVLTHGGGHEACLAIFDGKTAIRDDLAELMSSLPTPDHPRWMMLPLDVVFTRPSDLP